MATSFGCIQVFKGRMLPDRWNCPGLLARCGLVTPYSYTSLGHHWISQWLVAWRHQAITRTNYDFMNLIQPQRTSMLVPLFAEKWVSFNSCNFQMDFSGWWLRHLLWNCPNINVTGLHGWSVSIGSGNGLVPSGNKPLPEPMLTQIAVAIWCH